MYKKYPVLKTLLLVMFVTLGAGRVSASSSPGSVVNLLHLDTLPYVDDAGSSRAARAFVIDALMDRLDVAHIAERISGAGWQTATTAKRRELAELVGANLGAAYIQMMSGVSDVRVKLKGGPLSDAQAQVPVHLSRDDGSTFEVQYHLARRGDAWTIVDVRVNGIRTVALYAAVYAGLVQMRGIDGLIAHLRQKLREAGPMSVAGA